MILHVINFRLLITSIKYFEVKQDKCKFVIPVETLRKHDTNIHFLYMDYLSDMLF